MNNLNEHLNYSKYKDQWSRIRDVMEGSDKIKTEGTTYLPQLSGQTDPEYDAYKLRANFVNLSSRIVSTNTGLMFSKEPIINLPKVLKYLEKDTESFMSIYELFYSVTSESLQMGRVGVMLDVRDDLIVPVLYQTESIVHWVVEDGELVSVTLNETEIMDGVEEVDTVIEFNMIDDKERGYVCVVTKTSGDIISNIFPSYKGRHLSFIPFCCVNTRGISLEPAKSPILDVVDMNLSHYRSSADYEHGLHFVAMPTPVITGVSDIGNIKIGASAIILPDPKSQAFYMEFLGQGLNSLEKALSVKQAQISMFSARIQDTSTKGSESENIVKLRYSTDTATLHDIAIVVELLMRRVCDMILQWMGEVDENWVIELDKNFIDSKLSYQELQTLSDCLISGTIDEETYIYNLRRGQVIEEGHNMDVNIKEAASEQSGAASGNIADNLSVLGDK